MVVAMMSKQVDVVQRVALRNEIRGTASAFGAPESTTTNNNGTTRQRGIKPKVEISGLELLSSNNSNNNINNKKQQDNDCESTDSDDDSYANDSIELAKARKENSSMTRFQSKQPTMVRSSSTTLDQVCTTTTESTKTTITTKTLEEKPLFYFSLGKSTNHEHHHHPQQQPKPRLQRFPSCGTPRAA